MPEIIKINGTRIHKGENVRVDLNIARLPSHTLIDIPVYIYRAKIDGPVLLLLAGMHGDEVNGVEVIRRMMANKRLKLTHGTVIAIPVLNIFGFLNFSRDVQVGKDVNRSFPGNEKGSLASRVAYVFMQEILPLVDYGVDFHTGGGSRSNYPQIRCTWDKKINLELAKAFAPRFILNASLRDKSLRKEAMKRNKPILVYEGGESLRFDEHAINHAIEGTVRLMNHLGMVDECEPPEEPVMLQRSTWIRARIAGMFRAYVSNGEQIRKNQVIGSITDPYGEYYKKIRSSHTGYIIGLNHMPVVHQGDALYHVGLEG